MKIEINWKNNVNVFVLPEIIATKYINKVEYDFLKVILCIFYRKSDLLDINLIGKDTKIDEDVLKDILRYWHNEGIITLNDDKKDIIKTTVNDKELLLTKEEYSEIAFKDEDIKFLLNHLESILLRNMVHSECKVFISLNKMYGLPIDVILMLTQYCVNNKKDNVAYIKKVAINWVNLGIDTLEKVEIHIMKLEEIDRNESFICNVFGISSRVLTRKEKEFSNKWINDLKVGDEVLQEAYNRCVDNIGKISFSYINKIITGWSEKGYKTLDTILLYEKDRFIKFENNKDIEDFDRDINSIYNEV